MANILWTDKAQNDFIQIRRYTSVDSPLQADWLIEGIFTKTQVLDRLPEIGKN